MRRGNSNLVRVWIPEAGPLNYVVTHIDEIEATLINLDFDKSVRVGRLIKISLYPRS